MSGEDGLMAIAKAVQAVAEATAANNEISKQFLVFLQKRDESIGELQRLELEIKQIGHATDVAINSKIHDMLSTPTLRDAFARHHVETRIGWRNTEKLLEPGEPK